MDIKKTTIPIFEVFDKNRKYEIFANGKIRGFSRNAIVINRVPSIIALQKAIQFNKENAPACPTSNDKPSLLGFSQGTP
jgi:hypothetical protein